MSLSQKEVLRQALEMALAVSKLTTNTYDEIIVSAVVAILDKIFQLNIQK